jgi:hypothetical protein
MTATTLERDERTTAIENAGYRWSYMVLSFGVLAIVAIHSFTHWQSSWDLFALVVGSGFVNTAYQRYHQVLFRRWAIRTAIMMICAALVAVLIVALRH